MKMRDLIVGALIIVLFTFRMAEGDEWKFIGQSHSGEMKWYIGGANVLQASQDIVQVSVKIVHSNKEVPGERQGLYKDLKDTGALMECQCATKTYRIVVETDFAECGIIGSHVERNPEWVHLSPESVNEAIFKAVCPENAKNKERQGSTLDSEKK